MTAQHYPIEIQPPDIAPYRDGNTGVDYVHVLDSGRPGPTAMVQALTHGNEICGASRSHFLFRSGLRPETGRLILAFANVEAFSRFDFDDPDASRCVERTLFRAGEGPVPAGAHLQSPDYDVAARRLVATLRGPGAPRITALFDLAGGFQRLGGAGDCQVAWSDDRRRVYFVGTGGRQKLALYTLLPGGQPEVWLDLPGELSHEYFPRQSADGRFLVLAAIAGGKEHEHDAGDYEIFLWRIGDPPGDAVRLTRHSGNDCWPDLFLLPPAAPSGARQ